MKWPQKASQRMEGGQRSKTLSLEIEGFVDFTAGDQGFYDRQLVINNPSTENWNDCSIITSVIRETY